MNIERPEMQLGLSEWVKLKEELYPIHTRIIVWLLMGSFSLLTWSIVIGLFLWMM
jgi:hypothetical protein